MLPAINNKYILYKYKLLWPFLKSGQKAERRYHTSVFSYVYSISALNIHHQKAKRAVPLQAISTQFQLKLAVFSSQV